MGARQPAAAVQRPGLGGRDLDLALISLLVFLSHDLEEAWHVDIANATYKDVVERLPARVSKRLPALEASRCEMLLCAAQFLTIEAMTVAWARRRPAGETLLSTLVAARLLNGVQHVTQSLALRRYIPGVATAPAANIAFGALLLRRLRRDGPQPPPALTWILIAGAALIPALAAAARMGARITCTQADWIRGGAGQKVRDVVRVDQTPDFMEHVGE